jgi:putative glutamine amidotransferase
MTNPKPLIAVAGRFLDAGKISGWTSPAVGVQVPYIDALHRAGGEEAILLPVELDEEEATRRLSRFDGLLMLGGGAVHPSLYGEGSDPRLWGINTTSDAFEIPLARAAAAMRIPTLAVCRGIQVLNVALGGTLLQHIELVDGTDHGDPGTRTASHAIRLAPGSRIAAVMASPDLGDPVCTSEHHQAVSRLGDGLVPTAWAADGIVEAVEHEEGWVVAVQWHPEVTAATDPRQQALFDALVRRAAGD